MDPSHLDATDSGFFGCLCAAIGLYSEHSARWWLFFFYLAQQPPVGQGLLIHPVSR